MSAAPVWRLLSRPDCLLCEEFLAALTRARPQQAVVQVDVDSDPVLARRYGLRIPVLLDETGARIAEGQLDENALPGPQDRA